MKIVIQMNHGTDRSFLLNVNGGMSPGAVREILSGQDHDLAVHELIKRSFVIKELIGLEKREAERNADFMVSNDFVTERLA